MEQLKVIASDEQLTEQLQNCNWEELWTKLTGRCLWILRKRYNVNWSNEKAKEFSRETIADVIDKIFVKKIRKWNTQKYPDFEEFITGVIDSHINNQLNVDEKETPYEGEFFSKMNLSVESNAEDVEVAIQLRKQIYTELENSGASDEELFIFECLADGINKPEDLKKELGLGTEEFHNAWRRFKRRRRIIQEKLTVHGY